MGFLLTNTSGATITIDDLGGRQFDSLTTDYDLSQEFSDIEIRNSESLALLLDSGQITAKDTTYEPAPGKPITSSADLKLYALKQDSDDIPEGSVNKYASVANVQAAMGSLSIGDLSDVNLPVTLNINDVLLYDGTSLTVSTLNSDSLIEGTTNLFYTDARARNAIGIDPGSSSYLGYDSVTGLISIKSLSIQSVTVDSVQSTFNDWILNVYSLNPTNWQEGDIVVGTTYKETYIHNGGNSGDATDWTLLDQPNIDLLSFSANAPILYDGNGTFSLDLKTDGGLFVDAGQLAVDLSNTNINGVLGVSSGGTGTNIVPQNGELLIGNGSGYDVTTLNSLGSLSINNGPGFIDIDIANRGVIESHLNISNGIPGTTGQVLTSDGHDGFMWQDQVVVTKSWEWAAGVNNTGVTNRYLKNSANIPSNLVGYTAWTNATIVAMTAACQNAATWDAEIHVNGSLVYSLSLTNTTSNYINGLNITLNAGDVVSFYCNGTGIDRPFINILCEETV